MSTVKIEEFGNLIKEEREKQGIGVSELAKKVGVTRRAIQYWESGGRGISLENADKVLDALNIGIVIGKKEK